MKPSKVSVKPQKPTGHPKELTGTVISTKMNKTIIVAVTHVTRHPLYKKAMSRIHTLAVHNDSIAVAPGDIVRIVETRPISLRKHFRVLALVRKDAQ